LRYTPTEEDILFGDANETFHGIKLDEGKLKRLNSLRALCATLSATDGRVKYKAYPFSDAQRNATVILDLPEVWFCTDRRVMRMLAEAFEKADDATTTTLGEGLRISFGLRDMWTEFEYKD